MNAEASLRDSEEKYRALVEQAAVGIFICDMQGRFLEVNPSGGRMFGYSKEEILARQIRDLVAEEEVPRIAGGQEEIQVKRSIQQDWLCRRKDGSAFIAEISGTLLSDGRALAIVRDVTERKQTETALRISEENFRLLAETSNDMISRHNAEGVVEFVSPACRRLLGYEPAELLGMQGGDYVHPDEVDRLWATIHAQSAVSDSYRTEYRMRRKSGEYVWVEVAGRFLKDEKTGQVRAILCFTRDITERKQTEEALRQAELKYRSLIETIPAITFIASADEPPHVLFISPQVEALGYPRSEWTQNPDLWRQVIHPDDRERVLEQARECLVTGKFHDEYRVVTRDGRVLWVRDDSVVVRDGLGQPLYLQGIMLDITEVKLAETAVRAVSGRLLSLQEEERRRIARDLHDTTGQNLTAMIMHLTALKAAVPPTNLPGTKALEESLRLTRQCVQEIRLYSYLLHPPVLEELGLARAILEYAAGFQQRSGIKVELDLGTDAEKTPPDVAMALFRVVQEALGNIHRHSGSRTAAIRLWHDKSELWLEIADAGHGIPPEVLQAAGTPNGQLGVGLAGMRERMRHLGGRLEIHSGERGTTLQAIVPLGG